MHWTLILLLAASCESTASLADKNIAAQPVQPAHIVFFFH
jgi:hypothetical protein